MSDTAGRGGGPHMAFGNPPLTSHSLATKYLSWKERIQYLRFGQNKLNKLRKSPPSKLPLVPQAWKNSFRFVVKVYMLGAFCAKSMFKKISAVLDQIFWRRKKVIWHLFIVWKVFWAHYIIYWKKFDAKYFSLKEQIWWISITLLQVRMAEICWKVGSFPQPRCRNILSGQKGKIKNR